MNRRRFLGVGMASALVGLTTGRSALASGWGACGTSVELIQEEFLDLTVWNAEVEQLAHFFTAGRSAGLERRVAVSPSGDTLCFADRSVTAFRVRRASGETATIPAPLGGVPVFGPDGRALYLELDTASAYADLVVANASTGDHETWGDFFKPGRPVLAPGGLLIAHGRPESTEGVLTWLTGRGRARSLVTASAIPHHLSVRGSHAYYFVEGAAFALDLAASAPEPQPVGALGHAPLAAVATAAGLVATDERGAWLLKAGQAPRLLHEEPQLDTVVAHRGVLALSSRAGVWLARGTRFASLTVPSAEAASLGPVMGADAFVATRGTWVYRCRAGAEPTLIGRGRSGMTLRGAALFSAGLVTWSSRHSTADGAGCSAGY